MTIFEAIVLLALTAIVIILVIHSIAVIKEIKVAREEYKRTWSHFDNVVSQLYGIKEYVESIYNALGADGVLTSKKLSTIANYTHGVEQAVKDLLAFETRHEQRNDEMFARCEEINKLQLEQLRAKVHTYDTETIAADENNTTNNEDKGFIAMQDGKPA